MRHAIGAGDLAAAGELVWRGTLPAVSRGDKQTAEAWLGLFTDAERLATPTLALASAATQLASGQGHLAEHWTQAALAAPAPSRHWRPTRTSCTRRSRARAWLGMGDEAVSAYALMPDGSPQRALCCLLTGTAGQLAGDDALGTAALEEGAHRAAVTAPDVHALCLTQLALPALAREDWEEAGALVARARAQVERYRLDAYPTAALVLAASALVRAHRGRVEEAQRDFRVACELRTQLVDFADWYDIELAVVLARAAIRLSDLGGARDLLTDAGRAIRRLRGRGAAGGVARGSWAILDAVLGPASVAPAALTTAELRILRFLPTHLSFREIGERVHVTANTVKTQANAVYRKLDVSCRSDAVTRARQLGMLDT